MSSGIGPADIDIDIDIDINTDSGAPARNPGTTIRPIGVSPVLKEQPGEDWFRGNKWPPLDEPYTFQTVSLRKDSKRDFPKSPWTAEFYSIAMMGELVQAEISPAPAGTLVTPAGAPLKWDTMDLSGILNAADVGEELDELTRLIEYRAGVFAEAQMQAQGIIAYFRGILQFTQQSHPWTYGLATIGVQVGQFQAMHYKAIFNRPRASRLSPSLLPPIEVPGHASYPSAHSTQSHLVANLLADAMPDQANQATDSTGATDIPHGPLQRMAERISRNREVLGLHYPSDSAAGKLLADQTYLLLKSSDIVSKIIDWARAEWEEHDLP
ncbi:MAG TPA: hypothetical protein VFQ90_17010 [Stellaceae bacterium]|jgi:hypothetical protein|nr:hypothetical protein [Stellaceae bacterium]